jgi:hypothetical protein
LAAAVDEVSRLDTFRQREQIVTGWTAHAVGEGREEVLKVIREAIEFHIDGLKQDGLPVPTPSSEGDFVEVGPA